MPLFKSLAISETCMLQLTRCVIPLELAPKDLLRELNVTAIVATVTIACHSCSFKSTIVRPMLVTSDDEPVRAGCMCLQHNNQTSCPAPLSEVVQALLLTVTTGGQAID